MEDLIMKKLIVLFSVVLFCLSGISRDLGASWIVTGEGKIDCKKITLGYSKARVVLENGDKKAISLSAISSYSLNGKVFTRLPLYENGKPTGQSAFMELIKDCYGFSLYKYEYSNTNLNGKISSFFLYDGNRLHLALDEKSMSNIFDHFKISYANR